MAQLTRRSAARWVAPPSGRASLPRWVRGAAVEPLPQTLTPTLALTLTPPANLSSSLLYQASSGAAARAAAARAAVARAGQAGRP